jgi:hypothetical protein
MFFLMITPIRRLINFMNNKPLSSILVIVLMAGMTASIQGCAATKCDCPTFGGHHLKH